MPSSATSSLRLEKMASGDNLNTWGDPHLNTDFDLIDAAIAGYAVVALTVDRTLTTANYTTDEARSAMLKFTGIGAFTVTIPSVSKTYLVWNACTGAVTLTTGAGATVVVDPGARMLVFCDGVAAYQPGYAGLGLKDYIDSVALGGTGSLPATAGNAGKFLFCDGSTWLPKFAATTDLVDITTFITGREDFSVVMALIL